MWGKRELETNYQSKSYNRSSPAKSKREEEAKPTRGTVGRPLVFLLPRALGLRVRGASSRVASREKKTSALRCGWSLFPYKTDGPRRRYRGHGGLGVGQGEIGANRGTTNDNSRAERSLFPTQLREENEIQALLVDFKFEEYRIRSIRLNGICVASWV